MILVTHAAKARGYLSGPFAVSYFTATTTSRMTACSTQCSSES